MGLIFFDLDGTLVDPVAAMEQAAELTYHEFALEPPARAELAATVGSGAAALFQSHPEFRNPARLAAALESYWIHFEQTSLHRHRVYDGVPMMLARLKRQGHRIYLVTVLPTRLARRVLHQFDLLLAFDEVFGNTPEGPGQAKGALVDQLQSLGVIAEPGFLVGDRGADMATALHNGLRPLGAGYGFAAPGELQAAGAERVFASVPELDAWLTREWPEPERFDPFTRSE
jgi:phosphoglycolate phosphatase